MLKKLLQVCALLLLSNTVFAQDFVTVFERSGGDSSATYEQTINYYQRLAKRYPKVNMKPVGKTDTHYPLHIIFYTSDGNSNIKDWKKEGRVIMLINNGIHPGEPDGIDASMMLLRDAATGKLKVPKNIVLAVVPVFNIGGALNRNSFSRANQNGPAAYGFRGNAQNLDLNRDFIKMDAQETHTLIKLFHMLDPDVFIDNHVSNGADYQHTLSLLSTQRSKLGGKMGAYLHDSFEPLIYKKMASMGHDIVPYVNVWGKTPENGWPAFLETPRFASGFGALFQSYSFVTETHMLKPYKDRVVATYDLMWSMIQISAEQAKQIKETRLADRNKIVKADTMPINWQIDTTDYDMVHFAGYEGRYEPSSLSAKPRLLYDRTKPYTKKVPFFNTYTATAVVTAPKAYIIKQGWNSVIERLRLNGVSVRMVERDTIMELGVYYIKDYSTTPSPYEGHYLHSNVATKKVKRMVKVRKGDFVVKTNQYAKRYIIETLEPEAPDAFFAWGFFDAVLQQKEHYSSYVFEDVAYQLVQDNEVLRDKYNERMKADSTFANNGAAQLDFIYKNSPYYEETHKQYPVFRVE